MMPEDFKLWLMDNGLTPKMAGPLFLVTPSTIEKWCRRSRTIPRSVQAAAMHLAVRLQARKRGPQLCACGCKAFTYKSVFTGCFNLYLPDHSPAAKKARIALERLGKPLPPLREVHTECPVCKVELTPGVFVTNKRSLVGAQCPKCSYRLFVRQAS